MRTVSLWLRRALVCLWDWRVVVLQLASAVRLAHLRLRRTAQMTSESGGDVTLTMTISAVADMAIFSRTLTTEAVSVKQLQQQADVVRPGDCGPVTTSSWLYAASVTVDRRSADATYLQTQRCWKGQSLPVKQLNVVFCTTVMSRILYALPAWGGFLTNELITKFDGFF